MGPIFRILISFLFTSYFLLLTSCAHAASEFSTSYDIEYTVDSKGVTTTKQQISLHNLFENVYATEYSIIIGSTSISDITASDNFGQIEPQVRKDTNSTNINLKFDKHIIGKDKTRNVTVTYKSPDFASVKGQVLEVGFPLLANSNEMADYRVIINIPNSFGKATQVVPTPSSSDKDEQFTRYVFEKSTLIDQDSISATFGTSQIYAFTLRYNLDNPNQVRGRTEVALPADTNYQQVLYDSIDPKPDQVNVDDDGNWLAQYVLDPGAKITVEAHGNVRLSYFPRSEFAKPLTDDERKKYTSPQKYWESDDQLVRSVSSQHSTAKLIYDYLVREFSYDYERLNGNTGRMGAPQALRSPVNAICMEFTDTFIALARAAGIPAREHNGYAYTENDKLRPLSLDQDVLHAWPEYFDSKTNQWIQIDPTWGKTTGGLNFFDKFDLDHISFVRHGIDSSYPITAGSYKHEGQKTKDVEISFSSQFIPKPLLELTLQTPQKGIAGFPVSGLLNVSNTGNMAMYDSPYTLELLYGQSTIEKSDSRIPVVPPYGTYTRPLTFTSDWRSRGGMYTYKVTSSTDTKTSSFSVQPVIDLKVISTIIFIPTSLALLLIVIRRKRKSKKYSYRSYPPIRSF